MMYQRVTYRFSQLGLGHVSVPFGFKCYRDSNETGIGRKFALVEACSFLVNFLKDWRIEIILQTGETREQWRERVMVSETKMTMGVGDIPVRLIRR
jgi:hypothetical protein